MSTCQNCGYELVLLSRRKYKCSLCSKLYFPKKIEYRTFRTWNQKQRELDIHNFKLDFRKKRIELRELRNSIRKMFKSPSHYNKKEQWKLWRLKNLEKIQIKERKYYSKNKDKINTKRREKWKLNNENLNTLRKLRRDRNKSLTKLQSRIDYWKQQQKALADAHLKNEHYKLCEDILAHSVPTFLLCEQLRGS
tara:strand:- start:33 stop:611 length:579 start_codon:yes stop_codon:yes gene_type:complete